MSFGYRKLPITCFSILFVLMVMPMWGSATPYIWIEATEAVVHDVTHHNWYNRLDRSHFSQETWVTHYDGSKPGILGYDMNVPLSGIYRLWVRANPSNTGLAWRLDDGDWQALDMQQSRERLNVAADGSLDHRFIAWIDAGTVALKEGQQRITFRMKGGIQNSGILDCFVLHANRSWNPSGISRPGTVSGRATDGYVAWEPPAWHAGLDSVICLRHLNEDVAGQSGFVRREGDQFFLGSGKPVRFWTVQGDALQGLSRDRQRWWAQRLASYGVNLVRTGGGGFFQDWMRGDRDAFARRLDKYHALLASLKSEGIYLYINHLFWNTHVNVTLPSDVFPGFEDGHRANALLFFSEAFQDYYLEFLQALLTEKNPYTGISLAEDPALAFVEIQNESSLLFWSFNPQNFVDTERALIERKFGDWLKDRYGTLTEALESWGAHGHPHHIHRETLPDDLEIGRMRLYGVGHLTGADWARNQHNDQRASDQLQFMVETQKAFYARVSNKLRAMGVQALIVPSNWKTADERVLGALEHYTYTATDVIANNVYFGTDHPRGGNPRFYRIEVGDRFRNRSALKMPEEVRSLQHQRTANFPYLVTENNWNRPNRFRAEFPVLVSAYGSLSGINGWLFFTLGSDPWDHAMNVWGINDTTVLGQFPGTALMYRRGDIRQAGTVYHEPLRYDDLIAFKGQAMRAADGIGDPLYNEMLEQVQQDDFRPSVIDPLSFYVGRVTRSVGKGEEDAVVSDLTPYIDRRKKHIRSITGQLSWNYAVGYMTINTPRAQGVTGFLQQASRIELEDIVIESHNEYGSILVIALDDKPLSCSNSILVQAATEDKAYGFTTTKGDDGINVITRLRGYPLNMKPVDANIILKGARHIQAAVLDGNGVMKDADIEVEGVEKGMRVRLPSDNLYLWLHR